MRRNSVSRALMALFSVLLLLGGGVAPAATAVSAVGLAPVVTTDTTLAAVVIVVPPTQVANPLTGNKDNQSIAMQNLLGGWVADQTGGDPDNLRYVKYPQSLWWFTGLGDPMVDESREIGATSLDQHIQTAMQSGQPIVVVGYSQGASVNKWWLDKVQEGGVANFPDPNVLSFVNIANPNRPNGGPAQRFAGLYVPILGMSFDGATPSGTPYRVTEIARQYDGISDFPVHVLNAPAVVNAFMGMAFAHMFYDQIDLDDPSNIVNYDGSLTDVLVHTPVLPIMQPMYMGAHLVGRTETPLLDAISGPLRVVIEAGYDRTTAAATPADFDNPFKYVDANVLKESLRESVDILFHGAPGPTSSRTFTQFPDLREVAKVLTASPLDTQALTRAATRSAESYLYGKPKEAEAVQSPIAKNPEPEAVVSPQLKNEEVEEKDSLRTASKLVMSKSPKRSKLPALSRLSKLDIKVPTLRSSTSSDADDSPKSRPTKPGRVLKSVIDRVRKLTGSDAEPRSKPDKADASTQRKHKPGRDDSSSDSS